MVLAIKGHPTRGKEVIEILEMLGGKKEFVVNGNTSSKYRYYIDSDKMINVFTVGNEDLKYEYITFTLEEFLEKFPYKVGDKVNYIKYNDECPSVYTIQNMRWNGVTIEYLLDPSGFSALTKDLQPYEELSFGECIEKTINECLFGRDEDTMVKENYSPISLLPLGSKVMIVPTNEDSEIIEENGKFYLVKKQQQYPKTYEECHELMVQWKEYDCNPNSELILCDAPIHDFCKLIVARNIYWKIAGEQMGLGRPWEPDWDDNRTKYIITVAENKIYTDVTYIFNYVLCFPTEEMRDAFFENFGHLIELCKELL